MLSRQMTSTVSVATLPVSLWVIPVIPSYRGRGRPWHSSSDIISQRDEASGHRRTASARSGQASSRARVFACQRKTNTLPECKHNERSVSLLRNLSRDGRTLSNDRAHSACPPAPTLLRPEGERGTDGAGAREALAMSVTQRCSAASAGCVAAYTHCCLDGALCPFIPSPAAIAPLEVSRVHLDPRVELDVGDYRCRALAPVRADPYRLPCAPCGRTARRHHPQWW